MRSSFSLTLLIVVFSIPTIANAAVTLRVQGTDQHGRILFPGDALTPGDQLILDVTARSDGDSIGAIGISASGYDRGLLAFNSGRNTPSIFDVICLEDFGCFGGLTNTVGPEELEETYFDPPGAHKIQIFNAISIAGTTQSGEQDFGVSGVAGDPQAQLIFDVIGSGVIFAQQATVDVGAPSEFGDGLYLLNGGFGTVETYWVVPEPGTALLVGVGLIGLAARRPASRSES